MTEGNDTVIQKKHREWDGGEGNGGQSREEKGESGCEVGRKSKIDHWGFVKSWGLLRGREIH